MSEFFSHYPQISYDISGEKPAKFRTAINVLTRTKMKDVKKWENTDSRDSWTRHYKVFKKA